MTLAERIQEQRKRCGMSQEKLAELVGVSRQAVTKWEAGQSAPSTENLFRLAEIFGVTVDLLLESDGGGQSSAEQVYYLYKLEEEKKMAERQARRKKNLRAALWLTGLWVLLFAAGALSGGWTGSEHTLLGVMFDGYPFGWLVHNGLFFLCWAVCAAAALLGRLRLALSGTAGFGLGLLLGALLGENPAGAAYGHGHYGWLIWGGVFLFSLVMGLVLERLGKDGLHLRDKRLWLWLAVFAAGAAGITALVVLTVPKSFG